MPFSITRLFFVKASIILVCILPASLSFAQSRDKYVSVKIFYQNGSTGLKEIDARAFLKKYELVEKTSTQPLDIRQIDKILFDSTFYYFRIPTGTHSYVAVEELMKGEITLYGTPDEIENRLFFAGQDSLLRPLREIREEVGQNHIRKIDEYKSVIRSLTRSCALVTDKMINDLKLNKTSLSRVLTIYNRGCLLPSKEPIDSSRFILKKLNNNVQWFERILEGKISLYENVEKKNEFFVEKDTVFQPLQKYSKYIGGKQTEIEEYKSYLRLLTLDCKESETKINSVSLHKNSLYSFLSAYNKQCGWLKEETPMAGKKHFPDLSSLRVSFGVTGGHGFAKVKLPDDQSIRLKSPFLGVTFNVRYKYSDVSLWTALVGEYIYGNDVASHSGYSEDDKKIFYTNDVTYHYSLFELRDQIGLQFPVYKKKELEVVGRFGLSIDLQLVNQTYMKSHLTQLGSASVDEENDLHAASRISASPFFNVGFRYKRLEFFCQEQAMVRYLGNIDELSRVHRLGIGYSFK